MAERFENFNNILRDRAKDKEEKCLAEALNRFEKQVAKRWSRFFWENGPEKNFHAVSVGSRERLNQKQTWS